MAAGFEAHGMVGLCLAHVWVAGVKGWVGDIIEKKQRRSKWHCLPRPSAREPQVQLRPRLTLSSSRHPTAPCVTGDGSVICRGRIGGWISAGCNKSRTQLAEQPDSVGWGWEGFLDMESVSHMFFLAPGRIHSMPSLSPALG